MDALETLITRAATFFARAGGLMIALIAVAVAVDVVSRNLTGGSILNSFELSTYLFGVAVTFGMSYTALSGAHIRVDVLLPRLPAALRRGLDFAAFVSMAGLALVFARCAIELALESLHRGVVSSSAAAVPLGPPQLVWATGLVIFALTTCLLALRHGLCLLRGEGGLADRIGRFGQTEEAAEAIGDARRMEA
jgi:TRAP-type C4-dicarboxylate transport system permease small subunit